ncbi:hypothetical protein LTR54_006375 [Friedmanniomyces endolithicus]|uniref:Uncharacterized protein n=1 Tax=Friedmanniomyces endolithicus TaxID=329885 RepID=A0AAN6IZG3_9PEZI|nr:hypothetical protein LTR82_017428 [Friedmanniomyces endolithicus]KAK1007649.1 hypothetical protein LTR54_006375 [Friedmanniomyces endolithicus]
MPSGKDRIYVALYTRGGKPKMKGLEDKQVAKTRLSIGLQGKTIPSKETLVEVAGRPEYVWQFEEQATSYAAAAMMLTRVSVGKVANIKRLDSVLRSTPIRAEQPGWNCVAWVQEALEGLKEDGKALGTSVTDWVLIRDTAMHYVASKITQCRFDSSVSFDRSVVATWDLLAGVETVP